MQCQVIFCRVIKLAELDMEPLTENVLLLIMFYHQNYICYMVTHVI